MKINELIGRDLDTIRRTARCLALAIKDLDQRAYETFLTQDVQVGMFFFSDQLSLGPINDKSMIDRLSFEMNKNGYDEKYHTFAVRYLDNGVLVRTSFAKVRPALNAFAELYVTIHNKGL